MNLIERQKTRCKKAKERTNLWSKLDDFMLLIIDSILKEIEAEVLVGST